MSHDSTPSGPGVRYVRVEDDREGQRLDNFLFSQLRGVPRSRVYRIIRDGQVRVNRRRVRQGYRLEPGDEVRIPPVRTASGTQMPEPGRALARQLESALLHEDRRLLIYNKPGGLAVHGGSGIHRGFIESLRVLRPDDPSLELVHRLDRDTSGCLMVSRHRGFLRRLQRLMQDGGIEKRYWLLCRGYPGGEQIVEAPLRKEMRGSERIVRVSREGKPARTRFRLLERLDGMELVEAILDTGRTHQIRVHAAWAGFAVLGDPKYGRDGDQPPGQRLFLHARSLRLRHPDSGEVLSVTAPLDETFRAALEQGRRQG